MAPLFRRRHALEGDHQFGNLLPKLCGNLQKSRIGVFLPIDQPLIQAVRGSLIVPRFEDLDQLLIPLQLMDMPGRQMSGKSFAKRTIS